MMLEYWIWLTTLPRIGPVTANRLMKKFGHPENVYHSLEEELKKVGDLTNAQRSILLENRDLDDAKRILEECDQKHISLLPLADPRYPKRARNCKDTPILLYYKGKLRPIDHSVGIVGARRCTQETKHLVASLPRPMLRNTSQLSVGWPKASIRMRILHACRRVDIRLQCSRTASTSVIRVSMRN